MSGHSHAKTVAHKKGLAAAQRSKVFSKLASEITVSARDGGGDPVTNPRLRQVLEKAKEANMPSTNTQKAIKKGTGEETGTQLEEFLFEGYGPGGIALLIQGITDNKNRALGDIRQILTKHNGKLVEGGAVRWLFERKGTITVKTQGAKEDAELQSIEAGAEDLYWGENGLLDVYTKPTELEQVKTKLQEQKLEIESASLDWVAKERIDISTKDKESAERLFDSLDENESVQEIYSNIKE